jgi:GT2 family glycosyltransferase
MFSADSSDLGSWGSTEEDLQNFPLSLFYRCYITTSTALIKKEVLQAIGLFDASDEIRSCEDYDCWFRLIRAGYRFVHMPETLCLRRKHDEALTKNLKVITKAELSVIQKHSDWSVLPDSLLNARITNLYGRLADICVDNNHLREALKFSVSAWVRQPLSFNYVKKMVMGEF